MQEHIEPCLFLALDQEADPAIAAALKATLGVLLGVGAPLNPGYWLQLLGRVSLAAGAAAVQRPVGGTGEMDICSNALALPMFVVIETMPGPKAAYKWVEGTVHV